MATSIYQKLVQAGHPDYVDLKKLGLPKEVLSFLKSIGVTRGRWHEKNILEVVQKTIPGDGARLLRGFGASFFTWETLIEYRNL